MSTLPARDDLKIRSSLPYWNSSLPVESRVDDLLSRMTLEEKAGVMFHTMLAMSTGGTIATDVPKLNRDSAEKLIRGKAMNHFNLLGSINDARTMSQWHNEIQLLARETRLGIPITLSSDPRNHFTNNIGTGFQAGKFSQWPEALGLAALRSSALVEKFADIIRREYLAVGLRLALHPQVDLATEPRWSRISGGFGEDADLSSELVVAYIRGLQGPGPLGLSSVSTMTKHFPGGGPQLDGEDPHFPYGREQIYPGDNWEYHLRPFRAAIEAGTAQIMPYYGMPIGTKYEEVGFAFNQQIITDLLRNELGFKGIICTDWGLVTDAVIRGQNLPARAWGVEHLTEIERVQRLIEAGCDQLGGESCPELVVKLVRDGILPESRIDVSVRRLLTDKFLLGLFENPFVDVEAASTIVGCSEFYDAGQDAQRRSFTLLKNTNDLLPLTPGLKRKVYIEGISPDLVRARGLIVVEAFAEADFALLRLRAPAKPRSGGFEALFRSGPIEFDDKEKSRQSSIFRTVPLTIVDIHLDRPAVIIEISNAANALLVNYGASDEAFLDVIFGVAQPEGRLPFDLPSSEEAVRSSRSDMPYDTKDPIFRFGDGLQYKPSSTNDST
ncbi:Glycoside hydrolase, superfamily [Penicillium expansum]|uniref:beta-glucosidase n=1 Tax=Penicillium expansum TaxID=27334 RepID=A0A0A2JVW8_PENEN|nr:Glycoside hydrolase, superfamily [Penicillium expansum]KGO58976.1 Glycoside hydrolase, superfamily [Penicillium expansum]